jgi:TatD DNase family protein
VQGVRGPTPPIQMIDSHCHLADEAFAHDLDAVVDRAKGAGLSAALCIVGAGDQAEMQRAEGVRERWNAVRFATGVHPHNAGTFAGGGAAAQATREAVTRVDACAVGEIGLDYHYTFSEPGVQQEVFAAQIELALDLALPVIVHTREATDDTFAILRESGRGSVRGVFHCFTGDMAMARRALDLGFDISLAGIVTFPKAEALRAAARFVPSDRLLIETDSPYLAPVPHRGTRNEPAFVARVLDELASLRGEDRAALDRATDANFARLFRPTRASASA